MAEDSGDEHNGSEYKPLKRAWHPSDAPAPRVPMHAFQPKGESLQSVIFASALLLACVTYGFLGIPSFPKPLDPEGRQMSKGLALGAFWQQMNAYESPSAETGMVGLGLGREHGIDVLDNTGDDAIPDFPARKDTRVAVCLVGGARDSEVTLPSVMQHVLTAYPNTHLFVHSMLTERVFKLMSLAWTAPNVTIAAVRIYSNWWVDESKYPTQLVNDGYSPYGNQGIFQYMRLVEGCIPLISKHEAAAGFRFNWIVRTRLDTYWAGPPDPLLSYNPRAYTLPVGTNCTGLNDRYGVGPWRTSRFGLARLSMLNRIHAKWPELHNLNSERSFMRQLMASNTTWDLYSFPFCVVSRRVYKNDLMPVASIASPSPLNGAKCRPCTPEYTGPEADVRLATKYYEVARLGPIKTGVDLCNAREPWEANFTDIFDRDAGPAQAYQRRRMMGSSFHECVSEFEKLRERTLVWDSAPPKVLCLRRLLGATEMIGPARISMGTLVPLLREKYAGGVASVTAMLVASTGDRSHNYTQFWTYLLVDTYRKKLEGILARDGLSLEATIVPLSSRSADQGPGRSLQADILLLSIQRHQVLSVLHNWAVAKAPPQVCQLLVVYEDAPPNLRGTRSDNSLERDEATRILLGMHFWLDSCIREPDAQAERCIYFSLVNCVAGIDMT